MFPGIDPQRWDFDWFRCALGLEHSAVLPASGTWDAASQQHSGIGIMQSPVMDFDAMLIEASVWGAQVTSALDHHVSNYDCKDCGVTWIFFFNIFIGV